MLTFPLFEDTQGLDNVGKQQFNTCLVGPITFHEVQSKSSHKVPTKQTSLMSNLPSNEVMPHVCHNLSSRKREPMEEVMKEGHNCDH
jgi:hypothetical protein